MHEWMSYIMMIDDENCWFDNWTNPHDNIYILYTILYRYRL
jgi:hypothetical protein